MSDNPDVVVEYAGGIAFYVCDACDQGYVNYIEAQDHTEDCPHGGNNQ